MVESGVVRTLKSSTALTALAIAVIGLGSPAAARVSELIEVRVVNVDVTVNDRKGRPVAGLERADFEVQVDGKAVEIVNFYAVEPASSPRGGAGTTLPAIDTTPPETGTAPARPLQLAILVDSSNVEAHARNEALERMRDFLRAHLRAGAQVMLAAPRRGANAGTVAPYNVFTDRLDLVERGLDELAATPAQDRRLAEFREILQDIGVSLAASSASVRGRVRSLEARIRAFSAEASRGTARTAADLRRLVDRLAGLPGRKAILYLGGGLSLRPGEALSGALNQAIGRYVTQLPEGARAPDLPAPSPDDDSGELLALARYASVRGVAFYAVAVGDPMPGASATISRGSVEAGSGATPGQEESWAPAVGNRRQFDLESSLQLLAGATGGLATGGRDLGRLLDRLLEDSRAFFSLGIQPPDADPGEVHRLEVRIRGKRLRVRHRETFRAMSRDEEAAARTLSALWATVNDPNPLKIRLEAGDPRPAGNDVYSVPFSVQLPVAALAIAPRGEVHAGQVSIFFAARDRLAAGPVRKAVFPITLPDSEILEAMGRMADYRLELEMQQGPGKIAVGVRDDLDPRLSVHTLALVVGEVAEPLTPPGLLVAVETGEPRLAPAPATVPVPVPVNDPSLDPPLPPREDPSVSNKAKGKRRRKYRLPEDETADGYRHALRLLAGGDTAAAQAALRELESGAARHAAFDQLGKIESQVLLELEKASPDGLLPVALLHADLLPIYRRLSLAPLAEHALRMSRRLATSVASQGSLETRSVAGRVLTELAGMLLRAGRLGECEELFELALGAEEDNAVARLGLAVSHERRGRYEQAAEVLGPLAEKQPAHSEARLRLALNLERLDKTDRSRPLLKSLLKASPDWIPLLAVQETVRIAIRERRLKDASNVLAAALERWPGHPGLRTQQAFMLDRRGKPRQARDEVARLVAAGPPDMPSPRDRYNRWPASDAAQSELRESTGERLTDLGRALEAVTP